MRRAQANALSQLKVARGSDCVVKRRPNVWRDAVVSVNELSGRIASA